MADSTVNRISRQLALASTVALLLAGGCGTTAAVSQNSRAFHQNIAKASVLTDVGRTEAEVIYGAAWDAPDDIDQIIVRITDRFNASGAITVPSGIIQPHDCPGTNAITTPDGRILLCRDLFLDAQSEDEIAFVIGHELGHIVRKHNVRDSLPGGILTAGALATLGVGLALHDPTGATGWTQLLAMAGTQTAGWSMATGYLNSWKLPQELEADKIGIDLVARSGYATDVTLGYLASLPEPGQLLTAKDIQTRTPHPDSARRTAEAQAYINRMAYPEPDTASPFLPWREGGQITPDMKSYLEGREMTERLGDLALAINMFRVQEDNPRIYNSSQRRAAKAQGDQLCLKAMGLANDVFATSSGRDRLVVRQAAAMAFECNAEVGYGWLLALARSKNGGLTAADDLVGYWLYGDLERYDQEVGQFWGANIVPIAYHGLAYKFAHGFASQYLRNDLAYALSEECEKHEKETKTGCGWIGMKAGWDVRVSDNGTRPWSEILEYVQAPTIKMAIAMRQRATNYLNAGYPIPDVAATELATAEADRRSTAYASIELNVRAGPSTSFAVVTVIPRNGRVRLLSGRQGSWAEVEYNGRKGWASMSYLRAPR